MTALAGYTFRKAYVIQVIVLHVSTNSKMTSILLDLLLVAYSLPICPLQEDGFPKLCRSKFEELTFDELHCIKTSVSLTIFQITSVLSEHSFDSTGTCNTELTKQFLWKKNNVIARINEIIAFLYTGNTQTAAITEYKVKLLDMHRK